MRLARFLLILFVFPALGFASESTINFDILKTNYQEGKYNNILNENEFLFRSWLEKGYFDEYLANRKDSIKLAMQKYRRACGAKKKNQSKLNKIEKNKNRALFNICEFHPDLRISRMVKNILAYNKLTEQHKDALDYMAFLEFGMIDVSQDPAALPIQKMMFEYTLRYLVISSLLIDAKIGPGTAHVYHAIIELDKERQLRELCEHYPESYAAKMCLEAMDVNTAMLPIAYDKKYLGDLLVGMRAPENEVENKVRDILKDTHARKMELMAQY